MVKVGGRFIPDPSGKVIYEGGVKRYIHHIDMEHFTFGELFYAVHKMQLRSRPPTRAWYLPHEENNPQGLHPIENDESMNECGVV